MWTIAQRDMKIVFNEFRSSQTVIDMFCEMFSVQGTPNIHCEYDEFPSPSRLNLA